MTRITSPEDAKRFALNYVSTWDNVSDVTVTKIEKEELEQEDEFTWEVNGTYRFKQDRVGEFGVSLHESGTILGVYSAVHPLKAWEVKPGPK